MLGATFLLSWSDDLYSDLYYRDSMALKKQVPIDSTTFYKTRNKIPK